MNYLALALAFYLLGIFSVLILAALYLLHRPRYVAPTKYRGANRDRPERRHLYSELREGMDELRTMREREEGIDYKWLGVTGSEQE